MRERLREFALSLHPEKTRLIEFGRFAATNRKRRGLGKPETFNFLGFTFICGKSRRGDFQLKRKTRGDRMRAKLEEIKEELRKRMHQPIPDKGDGCAGGRRLFDYHAVPTNSRALGAFRYHVARALARTLRRRSQKDRTDLGHGWRSWLTNFSPSPVSSTPGQAYASPSNTRGRSRVRNVAPIVMWC